MADQIKVFELKIDVDAAIKSTSQLKTTTDNLKKTLKEFKDAGDTSSEAYVRTAAAVKNASSEYNQAQTQIGKLLALQGKEIKTVQQGRNALTILNKEWANTRNLYGETSKESLKLAKQHKMLKDRVMSFRKELVTPRQTLEDTAKDLKKQHRNRHFLEGRKEPYKLFYYFLNRFIKAFKSNCKALKPTT